MEGEQFKNPEEEGKQEESLNFEVQFEQPEKYPEAKEKLQDRIGAEKEELAQARERLKVQFEGKPQELKRVEKIHSSHEVKEEKTSLSKKFGLWVGKQFSGVTRALENRVRGFDIKTSGMENLKKLENSPYILAPNHVKPENILMQALGLSPDYFVVRRIIGKETHRTPTAVTSVTGRIRRIPLLGFIDRMWSPFREGIMEGAGFIPVKMRRGGESAGFNRRFVKKFGQAADEKEAIVMFPQGKWAAEFNPNQEFETGVGAMAARYSLPIVPVFIKGGHSWLAKEKVFVAFGKAINPEGKDKREITDEIKESIGQLSKDENIKE